MTALWRVRWWELSRSERQGFTNLSERETGVERDTESHYSVEIIVSLLNDLPPPPQRSPGNL